jgi:hypothetical protein
MEPRNRFQGIKSASLCNRASRYDNPIPTWFIAPIDCLKIPALNSDPIPALGREPKITILLLKNQGGQLKVPAYEHAKENQP